MFLVESLDADHEDMKHLKAVVYCRPSKENLACLKGVLRDPKFAEYNLCTCTDLATPITSCEPSSSCVFAFAITGRGQAVGLPSLPHSLAENLRW